MTYLLIVLDESPFSLFSSLLYTALSDGENSKASRGILQMLSEISHEHGVFQNTTELDAFNALTFSLLALANQQCLERVLEFLDNCFIRFIQRPIKYQDDLDSLFLRIQSQEEPKSVRAPLSLILMTILEQWRHLHHDTKRVYIVGSWLADFMIMLKASGEDDFILVQVANALSNNESDEIKRMFQKLYEATPKTVQAVRLQLRKVHQTSFDQISKTIESRQSLLGFTASDLLKQHSSATDTTIHMPPKEDEDHRGLHKWIGELPEEVVHDGALGELLLCLCSNHIAIRKEALLNLKKFMSILQSSAYPEKLQVWILLGEVLETVSDLSEEHPLPYVGGVFAVLALNIVSNPADFMYPKINKFLQRGPSWNIMRLPAYWEKTVLIGHSSQDDAYFMEVEWVLDLLYEGLRTSKVKFLSIMKYPLN
jgi:nucleolar pre-ribosomal-associated protein 1